MHPVWIDEIVERPSQGEQLGLTLLENLTPGATSSSQAATGLFGDIFHALRPCKLTSCDGNERVSVGFQGHASFGVCRDLRAGQMFRVRIILDDELRFRPEQIGNQIASLRIFLRSLTQADRTIALRAGYAKSPVSSGKSKNHAKEHLRWRSRFIGEKTQGAPCDSRASAARILVKKRPDLRNACERISFSQTRRSSWVKREGSAEDTSEHNCLKEGEIAGYLGKTQFGRRYVDVSSDLKKSPKGVVTDLMDAKIGKRGVFP